MRIISIRDQIVAALEGIENTTVYEGHIPDKVATFPGTDLIKPYLLVWLGAPTGQDETQEPISGDVDTDSDTLTITIIAVGADTNTVTHLVHHFRQKLAKTLVNGHPIKPDWAQQQSQYPLLDEQTTPPRTYVSLTWTLTTQ